MPRIQPLFPVGRLWSAPRSSACHHLVRFSTATRLRVDEPLKPASSSIKPPPPSVRSTTTAKSSAPPSSPSDAARAADLAAAEATTDADSAQSPVPKPNLPSDRSESDPPQPSKSSKATSNASAIRETPDGTTSTSTNATNSQAKSEKERKSRKPKAPKSPTLSLPPAKYHVARTATKNLPIYTDFKRGGNLHITTVRKITGDASALRDELRVFLNKKNEEVRINALTQHVIVKGHHVPQIAEFLKARGM